MIASSNPDLNLIAVRAWSNVRGMFFLNFVLTSETAVIISVCAEMSVETSYVSEGRQCPAAAPSDMMSVVKSRLSGE